MGVALFQFPECVADLVQRVGGGDGQVDLAAGHRLGELGEHRWSGDVEMLYDGHAAVAGREVGDGGDAVRPTTVAPR